MSTRPKRAQSAPRTRSTASLARRNQGTEATDRGVSRPDKSSSKATSKGFKNMRAAEFDLSRSIYHPPPSFQYVRQAPQRFQLSSSQIGSNWRGALASRPQSAHGRKAVITKRPDDPVDEFLDDPYYGRRVILTHGGNPLMHQKPYTHPHIGEKSLICSAGTEAPFEDRTSNKLYGSMTAEKEKNQKMFKRTAATKTFYQNISPDQMTKPKSDFETGGDFKRSSRMKKEFYENPRIENYDDNPARFRHDQTIRNTFFTTMSEHRRNQTRRHDFRRRCTSITNPLMEDYKLPG